MVRPRAWAVLRLMTSSNFVAWSTGRSAGFTPRRMLSTEVAARTIHVGKARTVGHEPADLHEVPRLVRCREASSRGRLDHGERSAPPRSRCSPTSRRSIGNRRSDHRSVAHGASGQVLLGVLLCACSLNGEWCGKHAASSRREERVPIPVVRWPGALRIAIAEAIRDKPIPAKCPGGPLRQSRRHRGTRATDLVTATR